MAQDGNDKLDIEIVGLVQNAKYSEVKDQIPPLFFRPYAQDDTHRLGALLRAHVARSEASILPTLPKVVATLDPNLPVDEPADDDRSR